jgi:hypothetical protein
MTDCVRGLTSCAGYAGGVVDDAEFAQYVARHLGGIGGVTAVTLGGSRAAGTHRPDSDWDGSGSSG